MQGVDSFGDFAIVLRMKLMTKPGEQFGIKRRAFMMIKKAFDGKRHQDRRAHRSRRGWRGDRGRCSSGNPNLEKEQGPLGGGEGHAIGLRGPVHVIRTRGTGHHAVVAGVLTNIVAWQDIRRLFVCVPTAICRWRQGLNGPECAGQY